MLDFMTSTKNFLINLKIIVLMSDIFFIHAGADLTNEFIIDFFKHKKPSSIVGYSCNNLTDDAKLIKLLSLNGFVTLLSKLSNNSGNILANSMKYYKIGVYIDTRCYDVNTITSFYFEATNRRLYNELYYWLILGDNLTEVLANTNDTAFGLSTDLIVAVSTGMENFQLYDVYNPYKAKNGTLNVTFYGNWNIHKRLNVELLQDKPIRRSNLHGITLKVMFYQALYKPKYVPLMDYFHDYSDITRDSRLRFGFFMLSHLSDILNFSIEYVEAGPWAHGDGLGPTVRALANYTVDLSGTPGNINNKRLSYVTFIHRGWPFRTIFILRNPQPKTIKIQELLRPFVNKVWYLMALLLLTSIAILALMLKCDPQEYYFRYASNSFISNSFIMTLGAMCQQATAIEPNRPSTRTAYLTIMLFSLLMYNYYSAVIVSARLDEPIFKIADSLNELGKLRIQLASERMFYLHWFYSTPDKLIQKFLKEYWFKIPESQQLMDPDVGMELVKKGSLAYHVHPDVAYLLIERSYENREICELMEVHWNTPIDTMFSTTKNTTFEEILKIGFSKISEVGLRHRQLKRWQYRKPVCRKDVLSASSINMSEFATHLILLVVGALIALIIHGLELMIFNQEIVLSMEPPDRRRSSMLLLLKNMIEG